MNLNGILRALAAPLLLIAGAGVVAQTDLAAQLNREFQRLYNMLEKTTETEPQTLNTLPFFVILPTHEVLAVGGVVTLISPPTIGVSVQGLQLTVDIAQVASSTSAFQIGEYLTIRGIWDDAGRVLRATDVNFIAPARDARTQDTIKNLIQFLKGRQLEVPPALKPFE